MDLGSVLVMPQRFGDSYKLVHIFIFFTIVFHLLFTIIYKD